MRNADNASCDLVSLEESCIPRRDALDVRDTVPVTGGDWPVRTGIRCIGDVQVTPICHTTLQGTEGSICVTERGDMDPVVRHPDFRLFAAMNPPTDASKKDLPPALRRR